MTAFIGFGMVLAIVVVAVVMIAMAVMGRRHNAPRPEPAYADDPTGYVPGVWLLGDADSATSGEHAQRHHAGDAEGADVAGAGGSGEAKDADRGGSAH